MKIVECINGFLVVDKDGIVIPKPYSSYKLAEKGMKAYQKKKSREYKQKLIFLLEECTRTGKLPDLTSDSSIGLCVVLFKLGIPKTNIKLFEPSPENYEELKNEGLPTLFWGRESFKYGFNEFTPLREAVLGFLIAMED